MNKEKGDQMKVIENRNLSIINGGGFTCRLDGMGFSKFTKGLDRPFDKGYRDLMLETTKHLVKYSNADLGYTQSDEITLIFKELNNWWGGRVFKIVSDLSSEASLFFNQEKSKYINKPNNAKFDCRVFETTPEEAFDILMWRVEDCFRNAIQMIAQNIFSHSQLESKSINTQIQMLATKGINWGQYPPEYTRGWVVRNTKVSIPFTQEELETLPPLHEARKNPNLVFERRKMKCEIMPLFSKIQNKTDFLFSNKEYS